MDELNKSIKTKNRCVYQFKKGKKIGRMCSISIDDERDNDEIFCIKHNNWFYKKHGDPYDQKIKKKIFMKYFLTK